jgi:predicted HTH transcriptional regulator
VKVWRQETTVLEGHIAMTTDELEGLLDGAEETDTLEFKGAMNWERHSLTRDILAMANVLDGGTIIIGIEDQTLMRQGLNEEQCASFNIEIMRDQVAPYAHPDVEFRCEIVPDRQALQFAVIQVSPFRDIPVICARDAPGLNAGDIYFRSRRRRPESVRISSSSEMRDIIEAAIVRRSSNLRRVGLVPITLNSFDYEAELEGL